MPCRRRVARDERPQRQAFRLSDAIEPCNGHVVRAVPGQPPQPVRPRRGASPWHRCARRLRTSQRGPSARAAPHGRPTGSPLHCPPVGFGRLSERRESCRLFPTKQRRNASPWQGEAGAQRRVRVDPVVHVGATRCVALVRSCTTAPHHPGCPRTTAPPGDPPGRPYMACRKGSDEPRTGTGVAHGVVLAVVRL